MGQWPPAQPPAQGLLALHVPMQQPRNHRQPDRDYKVLNGICSGAARELLQLHWAPQMSRKRLMVIDIHVTWLSCIGP